MARKKQKTWKLTAMTKDGCTTLFTFYKKNFGVELIEDRTLNADGVTWSFTITHPFPNGVE